MVQLVQFSQKTEDMFWETSLTFKYVLPINVKSWNQCNIPRISSYVAWELCIYVSTYILNISSMSNQLNPYYSGNWKLMDSLQAYTQYLLFLGMEATHVHNNKYERRSLPTYTEAMKHINSKHHNHLPPFPHHHQISNNFHHFSVGK